MRIPPRLVGLRTPRMEPVIPPPRPYDELYWAVIMDRYSDWGNDEVIQKDVHRLLQREWFSFKRFAIVEQGEPFEHYADLAARKTRGALQGSDRFVELWALSEVLRRPLYVHLHDKPGRALCFTDPRSKLRAAEQGDDLHLLLGKDRRYYLLQPALEASCSTSSGVCVSDNDSNGGELHLHSEAPLLQPRRRAPENIPLPITPPGSRADFSASTDGRHDHRINRSSCLLRPSDSDSVRTRSRCVSGSLMGDLVSAHGLAAVSASFSDHRKPDASPAPGSVSAYGLTSGPTVSEHPLGASAGPAGSIEGYRSPSPAAGRAAASGTARGASAAPISDYWSSDGQDAASSPIMARSLRASFTAARLHTASCSSTGPQSTSRSSTSLHSASGGPSLGGPCNGLSAARGLISASACGLAASQDSASADSAACSAAAAAGPPSPSRMDDSRRQTGLRRKSVERDCHSLYRALSLARYGTEVHHAYIRDEVMGYVSKKWEDDFGVFGLFPSLEIYLNKSSRLDYYSSELELLAACKLYRIRIVVHDGTQTVTPFEPPETQDGGEDRDVISVHLAQEGPFFHLLVPCDSEGRAQMALIASRSSSNGRHPPSSPSLDHTNVAAEPPVSRSQAKRRRLEDQSCGWGPPGCDPESFLSHPPRLPEQSAWPGAEAGVARLHCKEGLMSMNVGGDGNCLFRSLSLARFGTQEYHLGVRAEIINYVRLHWEDDLAAFAVDCRGHPFASLAAYLAQRACPGNYCGALEVLAASRMYGVRFVIHSKQDDIAFSPPKAQGGERGAQDLRSVHLAFAGSMVAGHYSLLVPACSPLAGTRARRSRFIWDCANSSMWFSSKDKTLSSPASVAPEEAGASGNTGAAQGASDDTDSSPCQGGARSVNAALPENSSRNLSDGDGLPSGSDSHRQDTKRPPLGTSAAPALLPTESWPGASRGVVRRPARELRPIQVVLDGDSLFRSLSLARFGTDEHHDLVRLEVMTYIVEHWRSFSGIAFDTRDQLFPTLDAYLGRHARSGNSPCGALEVRAASRLYRACVSVYRMASCPIRALDLEESTEQEKGKCLRSIYLGVASPGSRTAGIGHFCLLVAPNSPLAADSPLATAAGRVPRGGGGPRGRKCHQWLRR